MPRSKGRRSPAAVTTWLLDRGNGRRGSTCSTPIEFTTEALRSEIAARARAKEPDVVVYQNYRGPNVVVPLLLIFADATIGVWAVGNDVSSFRKFALKPAHRALDALVVVGSSNSLGLTYFTNDSRHERRVYDLRFPNLFRCIASVGTRSFAISSMQEYDYASRAMRELHEPDDGKTTVDDVLAIIRASDRPKLTGDTSVQCARQAIRDALRVRASSGDKPRLDEATIRRALRAHISTSHTGPGHLISELPLRVYIENIANGGAVADEALVAPTGFHFWEIKGETDSFARIARQLAVYERLATTATLVVAETHAARAAKVVPAWWGLTVARFSDGAVMLEMLRPAEINENRGRADMLEQLLANEVRSLARRFGVIRNVRSGGTNEVRLRVLAELSDDEITYYVAHGIATRGRGERMSAWGALHPDAAWPPDPREHAQPLCSKVSSTALSAKSLSLFDDGWRVYAN